MEIVSTFCTTFSQFFPGLYVADFLCWALDDAKYARKICSWGQHTGDWWRLGNHLRSIGGAYVTCPKKVVAWFDPDNGQASHVIDVIFQFYKISSFLGDDRHDQVNNSIAISVLFDTSCYFRLPALGCWSGIIFWLLWMMMMLIKKKINVRLIQLS